MADSASEAVKTKDIDAKTTSIPENESGTQRPYTPIGTSSDGEDERAARERLKKTSIAGLAQQSKDSGQHAEEQSPNQSSATDVAVESTHGTRGRPAKKRSFEDLARDDAGTEAETAVGQPPSPKSGHHKRMRSRDVASGDHHTYGTLNDIAGTVHEESDMEAHKSPGGPGVLVDAPSQEEMDAEAAQVRSSEHGESQEADDSNRQESKAAQLKSNSDTKPSQSGFGNTSSASGFANVSTSSPFGNAAPKSPTKPATEEPQPTSKSAFASSGLSAFASSEKSPFGAAGVSSSGFGSGGSSGFGPARVSGFGSGSGFGSKPSSFAGGLGGFGNNTSTFGGGSSAFGAPKPFGTSAAFGGGSALASSKPGAFGTGKPFGSSTRNEDDEGSGNEDEQGNDEVPIEADSEQDPRFHEQHVDTGEEGEETYFTCRAKLYHFEREWKEKGVGTLKLNIRLIEEHSETITKDVSVKATTEDDDDPESGLINYNMKRKARLLMRADGVHRVILNTPIFKGMRFGAVDGTMPTGKTMHLQGLEEGKPRGYQIKIGKEEVLKDLYHRLQELEEQAT